MADYDCVPIEGSAVALLLTEFERTHQGHVLLGRFRLRKRPPDEPWFRTGSKLWEYESFRELLGSTAVRSAMPTLAVPDPFPVSRPPEFPQSWSGTLTLDGELAATLMHGGAYVKFAGSAAEAKLLASNATQELLLDRHEDFRLFSSHAAWTPWFLDVAWDRTWLLVDDARLEATLLCLTDSD